MNRLPCDTGKIVQGQQTQAADLHHDQLLRWSRGGVQLMRAVRAVQVSVANAVSSSAMLQALATLALQGAGLAGLASVAFGWTAAFVFGLGWGCLDFVFLCNRLARLYRSGVTADVPDELMAQGVFDHVCVHALDQLTAGILFKRANDLFEFGGEPLKSCSASPIRSACNARNLCTVTGLRAVLMRGHQVHASIP